MNFIFTNCGDVCPLDTAQLRRCRTLLGDHAGRDMFMYSISVDPENDTPEALRGFMEQLRHRAGLDVPDGQARGHHADPEKLGLQPAGDKPAAHSTIDDSCERGDGTVRIKRSPYENPQMLANLLTGQLNPNGRNSAAAERSYADAVAVATDEGAQLYRTRCASCHAIGGGDGLGPDLLMVSSRRSPKWLARFIREPDKMLAEKDPIATPMVVKFRNLPMPNLQLSQKNVAELLAFIDLESRNVMEERAAAQHGAHHH